MITEYANQVARAAIAKRDAILKEAIDSRIGSGWSPHDLIGRLESQMTTSSGVERFSLDGKPLIEFYPAEPTQDHRESSHYVGYNQKYRLL